MVNFEVASSSSFPENEHYKLDATRFNNGSFTVTAFSSLSDGFELSKNRDLKMIEYLHISRISGFAADSKSADFCSFCSKVTPNA